MAEQFGTAGTSRWSFVAIGVGIWLASIHLAHLLIHDESLLASALGAGLPLVVASLVVAGGIWVREQPFDGESHRLIGAWTVAGASAAGLLAGFVFFHQLIEGHVIDEAIFLVASISTAGAAAGLLVGVNDAARRRRASQITALQRATTDLLEADSTDEVCRKTVTIAEEVLGLPINGIWLVTDDGTELRPTAISDAGLNTFGEPPTYRADEGLSWAAFSRGEVRQYDDLSGTPGTVNPDTAVRSEIILPLGEYGVMNVGSLSSNSFDDVDVTMARLLAQTATAALARADQEQRLRRRATDLKRQNERLDRFASVVSHDLRNPLSVAEGYVDLARTELKDGDADAAVDHLERIDDAHDRMYELIEDVLDLARTNDPLQGTEPIRIDDAAREAWTGVDGREASLTIDDARGVTILADPARVRQLFENLFRNAVQHAGDDVAVTVERTDGGFAVEDDGPGIPERHREAVFESGYTTGEDGVGVGLATVERIAADHGWTVTVVAGNRDRGARFEFDGVEGVER